MAKNKKVEPELITLAELSRRAGVSRQAVTSWIKEQEKSGIVLAVPVGRQGKMVDANDKLVMRYINNVTGKSNRTATQNKEAAGEKSPNTIRKMTYQSEKLRLQNILLREKYIERDLVFTYLDELFKLETGLYKAYPDKVLNAIEKEFEISIPPENWARVKKLMEEALESAHETNARIIAGFKKESAPEKSA